MWSLVMNNDYHNKYCWLRELWTVAYLRVGLVGPRPHQVRRCPTICGHILGYYTVNHQVPCHIIDCLTYTITTGSLVVVIAWASSLAYWSLADRHRDWSCSALVQTRKDGNFDRKWAWFSIFRWRASAPIWCPTTKQILATPLVMESDLMCPGGSRPPNIDCLSRSPSNCPVSRPQTTTS